MEDNLTADAIFYTFSTIAQVLAAIIALFGAALIFVINNFKNQLFGVGKEIRTKLLSGVVQSNFEGERRKYQISLEVVIEYFDFQKLKAKIDELKKWDKKNQIDKLEVSIKKFDKLEKKRDSYKIDSKNAIILNSVILILSVVVLPFAELLENSPLITICVIIILTSFFIVGFYKIIKLINRVFE